MIQAAAAGDGAQRESFAARYDRVVRTTLASRWRGQERVAWIDDAVQEVFIECFRGGGVLDRVAELRPPSFRKFLFGVTRKVAARVERRRYSSREMTIPDEALGETLSEGKGLLDVFERQWARALVQEALASVAAESGASALRRRDLLRLRFTENLPVREIAKQWGEDPVQVHRECSAARRDFRRCLEAIVAVHEPGTRAEVSRECERLLGLLG